MENVLSYSILEHHANVCEHLYLEPKKFPDFNQKSCLYVWMQWREISEVGGAPTYLQLTLRIVCTHENDGFAWRQVYFYLFSTKSAITAICFENYEMISRN